MIEDEGLICDSGKGLLSFPFFYPSFFHFYPYTKERCFFRESDETNSPPRIMPAYASYSPRTETKRNAYYYRGRLLEQQQKDKTKIRDKNEINEVHLIVRGR